MCLWLASLWARLCFLLKYKSASANSLTGKKLRMWVRVYSRGSHTTHELPACPYCCPVGEETRKPSLVGWMLHGDGQQHSPYVAEHTLSLGCWKDPLGEAQVGRCAACVGPVPASRPRWWHPPSLQHGAVPAGVCSTDVAVTPVFGGLWLALAAEAVVSQSKVGTGRSSAGVGGAAGPGQPCSMGR